MVDATLQVARKATAMAQGDSLGHYHSKIVFVHSAELTTQAWDSDPEFTDLTQD